MFINLSRRYQKKRNFLLIKAYNSQSYDVSFFVGYAFIQFLIIFFHF